MLANILIESRNRTSKLTKHRSRVKIRAQELAVAAQACLGSQAFHVCHLHEARKEVSQTLASLQLGVDVDLVLPFEFGPHGSELRLRALRRLDVVHDVDVNIVENNDIGVDSLLALVQYVAENDTRVGRRNLDGCLDVDKVVRADILRWWALYNLEVAKRCKLDGEILQCLCRLVDEEHVKHNVKLMHLKILARSHDCSCDNIP